MGAQNEHAPHISDRVAKRYTYSRDLYKFCIEEALWVSGNYKYTNSSVACKFPTMDIFVKYKNK